MSDVHVATHPSGHPNKTAVNAENPIFGRPADPTPEVSIEQAGVVQSDKHARETVVSPLINEDHLSLAVETKTYTDGTTATGVAPLPDLSPAQQQDAAGKEGIEPAEDSKDAEPVEEKPVEAAQDSTPSGADLDAAAAEQKAAEPDLPPAA